MDNSKENLERILTIFADNICSRYGISFPNGGYVLTLEEDMANDTVIHAGNPVKIRIHWRILAQSMEYNKLGEFKQQLQNCLEIASRRMLYTLSATPVSPVLTKDKGEKRWKKHKNTKGILPNLLPEKRIDYEIHITVRIRDKVTGKCVTYSGDAEEGATIDSLMNIAHKTLSEEVYGRTGENQTIGGGPENTPSQDGCTHLGNESEEGTTDSANPSRKEEAGSEATSSS